MLFPVTKGSSIRIGRTSFIAAALLSTLAGAAEAATLTTGPLRVDDGRSMECLLVNLGKKPLEVTYEARIHAEPVSVFTRVLQPGDAVGHVKVNEFVTTQPAWCRFTFNGSKKSVRAAMCVHDANLNCTGSLPAQ